MHIEVTNLTDGPGYSPEQIDIYTKTLSPGESIKIPAELVNEKLRRLAAGEKPKIALGQAPSWYLASKIRRGKTLTKDEVRRRLAARVPASPPPPASNVLKLELKDDLVIDDDFTSERRYTKKGK